MENRTLHEQFSPYPIHRQFSVDQLRKGVDCEHCGRLVKFNRKKLNITMMQYLAYLYNHKHEGWIQASRIRIAAKTSSSNEIKTIQTGDYLILQNWGLIETNEERNGFVRISTKGIDFVEGRIRVYESVILENYKNRFVRFDGPLIDIKTALGTSFNKEDL